MSRVFFGPLFSLMLVFQLVISTTSCRAEDFVHEIGVILPLSGDLAVVGEKVRKGIEYSVNSYGDSVKLRFQDGGSSAKEAVTAYHQIMSMSKPKAIIGPFGLDQTIAVAGASRASGVVILAVSACHDQYRDYQNIFCLYPSYDYQLNSTLEKFSGNSALRGKSLALYIHDSDSSAGIRKTMRSFAERSGMNVVFDETIIPETTDFRSHLVKARGVDVFFAAAHAPNVMVTIFKQLNDLGIKPEMRWWFSEEDNELIQQNSKLLEGVNVIGSFDRLSAKFLKDFSSEQNVAPDLYHALAADASATLFQALKASPDGSTEKLREALKNSSPQNPACKGFHFSSERTVALPLVSKRISNGELQVMQASKAAG